jgi:hypothetical protein
MTILSTLTQFLESVNDVTSRYALRRLIGPLWDRQSARALNTAGLVIHGGGSPVAKTGGTDCYLLANGVLRKITAATDMPALVGTVVNATFNVFCFFIDSGGTVTSLMGTAGATLLAVKFPQFPGQKALVGFLIINPTGAGNFVGGTTALDDGTVVPNTVYVSPVAGFDPYALIGGQ